MMKLQAQGSTRTSVNRYPHVFITLRQLMRTRHGEDLGAEQCRILSFGCSSGAEVLSLRRYFPDAELLGCDVNEDALDASVHALECDPAVTFFSDSRTIEALGPYDVIMANAVLCSYPASATKESLLDTFSFQAFTDLAEMLLAALKPDGLFVLTNANYFFRDLPSASHFQPVVSARIEGNGFVEKFGSDSLKVSKTPVFLSQRHYAHRLTADDRAYTDDDFRHCIFTRADRSVQIPAPALPLSNVVLESARLIMGGDPHDFAARRWIGAGLFRSVVEAANGEAVAVHEWRKTTIAGDIADLGQVHVRTAWLPERDPNLARVRWTKRPGRRRIPWFLRLKRRRT